MVRGDPANDRTGVYVFSGATAGVLAGLKWSGQLDWPWWWVLSPLSPAVVLLALAVAAAVLRRLVDR